MKYQSGFISNSSTCSFCILGWSKSKLTEENLQKLVEYEFDQLDDKEKKQIEDIADQEDWISDGECLEIMGLYTYEGEYGEVIGIYTGDTPNSIITQCEYLKETCSELNLPEPQLITGVYAC